MYLRSIFLWRKSIFLRCILFNIASHTHPNYPSNPPKARTHPDSETLSPIFSGHLAALCSVDLQMLHLFFLFASAFIPFFSLFSFLRPFTFDLGGLPTGFNNAPAPGFLVGRPSQPPADKVFNIRHNIFFMPAESPTSKLI